MSAEEKKQPGCGEAGCGLIAGIFVLVMLLRGCSGPSTQELDKRSAELLTQDKQQAAIVGLSLDDYRSARWASSKAYAACKVEASSRAKFDYKTDWIPNSDWTVRGKEITILGRDVQMQNGFGVYSHVTYTCVWNMETQRVVSLDIKTD